MKKILTIYLVILAGLFLALSLAGRGSDYAVEKKVWKLNQQKIDIARDPAVIPNNKFEQVIAGYENIIAKYPESRFVNGLRINIGEIYALRKDYDKAREIFNDLVESQKDNKELAAEALFKVGETYEVEGNWGKAYQTYQKVIAQYPLTHAGLNTPIHIANHYKGQNDFQATMMAYEYAIRHYKKIIESGKSSRTNLTALRHLANCYLDQNRWSEAIETMGTVIEKYSTSGYLNNNDVDLVIKTINITSAYKLKDYDVAIRLYQGIIKRNPNHPLNDYLNKVINAFKQLKERGIVVSEQI